MQKMNYPINKNIPSQFLNNDFEFEFEYLSGFLKHCNDFKSFLFEKPIGLGGFGEVWRVFNKRTRKRLAVKVINIKSKVRPEVLKKLVKIERNIMSQIDHPFICKCLYSFKSEKRFYLFMEYCPYKDLGFLCRTVLKGFGSRVVKLFLAEIVLAIGHLHANNIMHRDIKTENVLMDSTGHTKLTGNCIFIN
jgi:serine/threonine protein kinase